eukprot:Stramenopile-MAST_4_protein_2945
MSMKLKLAGDKSKHPKTPANNCVKRGEIVRDAKGLKSLLSGEVRSTLNLTKSNIDTFDTDEVGSLKMHVITDREFIVIPWKGVGSVDRSKQNFSYPIQTFKDCVASTHEVAGGYTSFKVALRKVPCNCTPCRKHWGLPFGSPSYEQHEWGCRHSELRPYPCVEDFPISIDTRPLDRDLYERARRRANKVQLKKVYAFYTEEDTELLWFAQVLEKPRVVVQGDIVCGTRATAANVREDSLIVKIRGFERKEDEAGSAYYQPELQDKDWPESYIWLISMRSPNINNLMQKNSQGVRISPFLSRGFNIDMDTTNPDITKKMSTPTKAPFIHVGSR